jgi:3-oxoacyl-[acyl-carrier-protein] synthase-3
MALFSIHNAKIDGISACVPRNSVSVLDYARLTEKERQLFVKTTGIENRRLADKSITTSDLCFHAAAKLVEELGWNKKEIGLLIFITQSPDYLLPATAPILQDRLGLSTQTIAFDINLGCSAYIYGLSVASSLISNKAVTKALLLVGDVSYYLIAESDRTTYPLFGDAGSATALSFHEDQKLDFNLQSDGSGYDAIIAPVGGCRKPFSNDLNCDTSMSLDGMKVFNFSLREVAPNIRELLKFNGEPKEKFDYYIFHQANLLMNEAIRKKLAIGADRVPYSLRQFGNTSSASIPLTMVTEIRSQLRQQRVHLILSGFGVGLSWGSASCMTDRIVCPELIEI